MPIVIDRSASDAEGSVMENLSRKWRDIAYTHPGVPETADEPSAMLSTTSSGVDDLFSIDRDEEAYSQVSCL